MALIGQERIDRFPDDLRCDADYHIGVGSAEREQIRKRGSKFENYFSKIVHPGEFTREYVTNGIPFLRAQNVKPGRIDSTNILQVSRSTYESLPEAVAAANDLLIVRTGANVGDVARVSKRFVGALVSSHTLRLVPTADAPVCALAVFLASDLGQRILVSLKTGSAQGQINGSSLKTLALPKLEKLERQCRTLLETAENFENAALREYPDAESELLERLGWVEMEKQSHELSFSINFSSLTTAARNDAERFHPTVARVRQFLTKQKAEDIGTVCSFVKHGLQPPYLNDGNVGIVSQRQFTGSGLDLDSLENFTNDEFCKENPDFRIRKSDVLTYCVSAGEYLGRTYLFGSDRPCVAASFVTILRTAKLVPGYLALFLNSPFGLIQSNAFKRGTSPFYLYPRDLKNVLVYVPRNKSGEIDIAWQEKLAAKVEASTHAREQAQAKLAEAKKLVEDALR